MKASTKINVQEVSPSPSEVVRKAILNITPLDSLEEQHTFDQDEFHSIRWFDLNEIPYEKSDPHMKRFINKLQKYF